MKAMKKSQRLLINIYLQYVTKWQVLFIQITEILLVIFTLYKKLLFFRNTSEYEVNRLIQNMKNISSFYKNICVKYIFNSSS